jgi:hypothetical protein
MLGKTEPMSRATLPPPSRRLLIFLATAFVAMSAALAVGTAPATAAKPCWERLIDDWVDNGRFDGTYSAACIEQARNHLPEDIRAYSDIEEKIDNLRLLAARSNSNGNGTGNRKGATPSKPSATPTDEQPASPSDPSTEAPTRNSGPFVEALNPNTNSADSIPLPLILLAGLALLLMAAGATGIAHRKLQARRANVRRPS